MYSKGVKPFQNMKLPGLSLYHKSKNPKGRQI